jgi:putative transcriptional regulator
MTQEDLAAQAGVSRQTIISLEKGKYNPSINLAYKLSRLFDLTIEELFLLKESGDNNESKESMVIKYLVLSILGVIAIWQIASGKYDFGVGLLAGLIIAGTALGIKNRRLSKMFEKGMNPYDERVWMMPEKPHMCLCGSLP